MEHSNKPLTFEKLKEMVGEPVYIDRLKRWGIVDCKDQSVYVKGYGDIAIETFCDDVSDYENTLAAYSYYPAKIDLESWKSEWERVCGSSECKNCGYDTKVESHFCPHCGKAMDQHALNIIKNQIGG